MNESNVLHAFGPNLLEILEKLTGQSALPSGVQIIASGNNIVAINHKGQMLIA